MLEKRTSYTATWVDASSLRFNKFIKAEVFTVPIMLGACDESEIIGYQLMWHFGAQRWCGCENSDPGEVNVNGKG